MTTTTHPSKILYTVFFGSFIVAEADTRAEADDLRDAHAVKYGHNPLSEKYVITPVLRKEKEH